MTPRSEFPVERFEELFLGEPAAIEQRLLELRPPAATHPDSTITPRIESLIALSLAMQGKINEAFSSLDEAEELPGAELPLARTRLRLERGRVFHQARRMVEARPWIVQAYRSACEAGLDYHAIDAAHMVAIVASDPVERIAWNRIAWDLAEATRDEKARAWRPVLLNNLGQAYVASGRFADALAAFQQCTRVARECGNPLIEMGARWGIARAKRSLGREAEALAIQQELLHEYDRFEKEGILPAELVGMARGAVKEELALLDPLRAREFAAAALLDLGVNTWFRDLEPARWAVLQERARESR
jgi:tetratricopeptide (TPR) repeat protein